MKLIRRKVNPVVTEEINAGEGSNDTANVIAKLDSEPGFFCQVIRPMLAPGHEGELIGWLKDIGLLPQEQRCRNASKNDICGAPMIWTSTGTSDIYQWKCLGCTEKRKIREDSIFHSIRCRFKDAIRLLLGWSKGNSSEMMADMLNIKRPIAKTAYHIASASARNFISEHTSEFRLGGPGVIVLVDVFPDINSNIAHRDYNSRSRLILCIAEVREIPTRFWFQSLERYSKTHVDQIEHINETALNIIQNVVLPGSLLVGNAHTTVCSHRILKRLGNRYPTVVSSEDLQRHDGPSRSALDSLEVIWAPALQVCDEVQLCKHSEVPLFLAHHLFCQRFGREAFEVLLNHLSY